MVKPHIELLITGTRQLTADEKERYKEHGFLYVVNKDCCCVYDDLEITIPAGFLTDGSSGGPDWGWAWLIHDYLYSAHKFDDGTPCTREQADEIMYYVLDFERHSFYKWAYKIINKIFRHKFQQAWKKSGRRGVMILTNEHSTLDSQDSSVLE